MEAARAWLFLLFFFWTVTARPDGNSLLHLHWMVSTKAGFYCSRMTYNALARSSSRVFEVLPKTPDMVLIKKGVMLFLSFTAAQLSNPSEHPVLNE